ncbi:hypothetical protein SDC9_165752 [bioreactor metagenome]|uniref:Uncharacterized protein n=1 Tax=bioreactor metagenome TaxID=1076179 RepID=A0A645FXF9_9ZZZZ
MHAAAQTFADSVGRTKHFTEHFSLVGTPSEGVAMTAMGGDYPVTLLKGKRQTRLRCLLSNGEMGGPMHLFPFEEGIDVLFEMTRTHHDRERRLRLFLG